VQNLSENIGHLLPLPTNAPTCSEHSQAIGLDPCGTALNIDAVFLIELPLPWPKPVFMHPDLIGLESIIDTSMGVTRVLTCQPRSNGQVTTVTVFCKEDATFDRWVFELESNDSLMELIETLISSKPKDITTSKQIKENKEAVLLCTQGSHDICCGSKGTRLAGQIEEQDNNIDLFKVSHLGGHRFSPTAMTLPDGRMWADLDLEILNSILKKRTETEQVAKFCRGWVGAKKGPEQIAEIEIFKQIGWEIDNQKRDVNSSTSNKGWSVEVLLSNEIWTVDITPGRQVPTITCRSEGGIPFTTESEYIVNSVEKLIKTETVSGS
jgi:hypothetical protein|tara:strand:+ start:801 stop:1769 length:969 start_codon:yes stop_codon:yes gene_type:complete